MRGARGRPCFSSLVWSHWLAVILLIFHFLFLFFSIFGTPGVLECTKYATEALHDGGLMDALDVCDEQTRTVALELLVGVYGICGVGQGTCHAEVDVRWAWHHPESRAHHNVFYWAPKAIRSRSVMCPQQGLAKVTPAPKHFKKSNTGAAKNAPPPRLTQGGLLHTGPKTC